jgi:valyl-tRNA synthetase
MDFGTGALGVTPAHSMTDWKMAEENDLEIKKVINEDGKINQGFGEFSGLTVQEARKAIVQKLKENKLLEKEEEIDNALSVCYRCDTPIEPLPSKQWFVSVNKKIERLNNKSLKEKAIDVAREKEISFIPNRFEKRYIDWMENLHDWCISRQIWFGHRIPVWYKNDEIYVDTEPPTDEENWTQDPDVLDTWFSSGMWTFSTLGWPDNFQDGKKLGDLKKFHPTQVLETGYEILTLWVSRMIMMSLFAVGEIPFEDVYLHGMVLDEHGKKMSKSKGNGIDPMDVIAQFGTDAVRLSLLIGNTPGNNLRIGEEKISGMRNLINKLWNIARFIETGYQISELSREKELKKENLTLADRWILLKTNQLIQEVDEDIKKYRFSEAGEKLKEFTWNELADWYLEISKIEKNKEEKEIILKKVLGDLLKLWHPFIPFVTEKIWQELFSENLLMIQSWPKADKADQQNIVGEEFALLKQVIGAIRNARSQYGIKPNQKIKTIIYGHHQTTLMENEKKLIAELGTNIEELTIQKDGEKIPHSYYEIIEGVEIYIPLEDIINLEEEVKKTRKKITETEQFIQTLQRKLSNQGFVANAPKEIVEKEKKKLSSQKNKLKNLKKYLEGLA